MNTVIVITITSQQTNVVFINIPCFFNRFFILIIANMLKQFINHDLNFLWIDKNDIIKIPILLSY